MQQHVRARTISLVLASLTVAAAGALTVSAGEPELWAPYSLTSFCFVGPVALLLGGLHLHGHALFVAATGLLWGAAFLLLAGIWPLMPLETLPRFRNIVLGVVALNAVFLVLTVPDGLKYEGSRHTYSVAAASLAISLLVAALAIRAARRRTYSQALLSRCAFMAWLAWIAFPWLGELI